MHSLSLMSFRNLAIIFMYSVLFGTAAFDKWKARGAPDWFIGTFEKTWIAKLPGGTSGAFKVIQGLETLLFVLFLASLFSAPLLPIALVVSLFLFAMLCLGLRLSSDFQGSANMFIYFAATLICLQMVRGYS